MKKFLKISIIGLGVLLLIFVIFTVLTFINYSRDKHPDKTFFAPYVASLKADIRSVNPDKSEIMVTLILVNHMPLSITGDSLDYSLYADGVRVLESRYKKSITLKGGDSTLVILPMTILMKDFNAVVDENEKHNRDSALYEVRISVVGRLIFKKTFKASFKRTLPMYRFPDAYGKELKISSLTPKLAEGHLILAINNTNTFALRSKDITYRFSLEDHKWVEGTIPGINILKPKTVNEIMIPVSISSKEAGKMLFEYLRHGKSVKYRLHVSFTLVSDNKLLSDAKISLYRTGSLETSARSAEKRN